MHDRLNKTTVGSVVFLDIVEYSRKPDADQILCRREFNAVLEAAIHDLPRNDRIILDTGDGAAITLFGEPEHALSVALAIRDGILRHNRKHPDRPIEVRMGINLGPVRVVHNLHGVPNVLGDGLHVAQRVMSFSAPNQILLSRSYYEIVVPENPELAGMLSYFGMRRDSEVRDYELYGVADSGSPSAGSRFGWPRWVAAVAALVCLAAAWALWSGFFTEAPARHAGVGADAPAAENAGEGDAPDDDSSSDKRTPARGHARPAACSDAQRALNQCG